MPRAEFECRWCGRTLGPVSMANHMRDDHTCEECHQPANAVLRGRLDFERRLCKPCFSQMAANDQARQLARDLGEARKANVRLTDEEMVAELLEMRTELADG